jgi:hypothetical protein
MVTKVGRDNRTWISLSDGLVGRSDQNKIVSQYDIKSKYNVAYILTQAWPEALSWHYCAPQTALEL